MGTFGVGIKVEIKIKIIQYVYMLYHIPSSLRGLYLDWKIEDSDGS